MAKNYYSILGIDKNSTGEEIKKAYRKLAMEFHPDKNPGDKLAEEKFKDVAEAYDVLSDPSKKAKYDRPEPAWGAGSNPFGAGTPFDDFMKASSNQRYAYSEDFFFEADGFFGGIPKRKVNKKGRGISINIPLSVAEMITGVQKKIKLKRNVNCTRCKGSGGETYQSCGRCGGQGYVTRVEDIGHWGRGSRRSVCDRCQGTGKVVLENCIDCLGEKTQTIDDLIDINILPGSIPGMQFVIAEKGHEDGATIPGDLIILIKDQNDPEYIRNGTTLKKICDVPLLDAIKGCKLKVRMPLGDVIQTVVEPGTQHGTILQFPGKGIPDMGIGTKGDFLVEIRVKIPEPKDQEDLDLIEDLRNNKLFSNE